MDTKTYQAVLNFADKVEGWATSVQNVKPELNQVLDKVAEGLTEFAEGMRAEATKQAAKDVWGETTDDPTGASTKASAKGTTRNSAETLASMVNRLKDEYLKTQHGATDANADDTVTKMVNDLYNRVKGTQAKRPRPDTDDYGQPL
jgi:hypothetical protein